MAIGWDEIGDLRQYASKTEMKKAMKEHIDPERPYTMGAHATWQFANEMKPGFNTDGFREYRAGLNSAKFDNLIQCVEQLNEAIAVDESLGEGFCIGHSYFCNLKEAGVQALARIVEYELIPLQKEYWFDEPLKVKNWADNLRSAIK